MTSTLAQERGAGPAPLSSRVRGPGDETDTTELRAGDPERPADRAPGDPDDPGGLPPAGSTAGPAAPAPLAGGGGPDGPGPPVTGGGDGHDDRAGTARSRRHRAANLLERALPHGLRVTALVPLAMLVFILVALALKAWPAIRYNGFGFFGRSTWNVGALYGAVVKTNGVTHLAGASYGILPLVVGTIESSAIAMILAIPIGVGTALLVVHKLPARLSSGVGFCLEVLAGIPSVIYGLWAVLTLGPLLSHELAGLSMDVPNVPVLRFFRGPTNPSGEGLLSSGVVLAVMVIPIIAATSRDLFRQVPRATVEGAEALGMSDLEATRAVTLPWVRSGIIGASMLGLGRALGETMAVAMVSGVLLGASPHSLYSTMSTIAATIVSTLDGALTDPTGFAVSALAEAGLVLLVITLVTNVAARLLVRRVAATALPVGRGI